MSTELLVITGRDPQMLPKVTTLPLDQSWTFFVGHDDDGYPSVCAQNGHPPVHWSIPGDKVVPHAGGAPVGAKAGFEYHAVFPLPNGPGADAVAVAVLLQISDALRSAPDTNGTRAVVLVSGRD